MTVLDQARTRPREVLLAGLPVRERRLQLAGFPTAVVEGGDGPPIVLLHGPAASATGWIRVLGGLAAGHRVVAPDLPGHGASSAEPDALDAERVLDWARALIDATCDAPPVVVGHLLGGAIAARLAAARPDTVGRLVLVDTLGLAEFAPEPAFGAALQAFLAEPGDASHDALWAHCAADLPALHRALGGRWAPFRAYNVERLRDGAVMACAGRLFGLFGQPAIEPEVLASIRVPTSLVWGRQDRATPLAAGQAASARYGWPLHVIDDCADDPAMEQPEAFIDAVLRAAP